MVMNEDSLQGDPLEDRKRKLHNLIEKQQNLLDELSDVEEEILTLMTKGHIIGWERNW